MRNLVFLTCLFFIGEFSSTFSNPETQFRSASGEIGCDGSNLRLIQGKCYAFIDIEGSFDDTQARCREIFGENIQGKIFEPSSKQLHDEILDVAKQVINPESNGPNYWIGVTYDFSEDNVVYSSNGNPLNFTPWASQQPNLDFQDWLCIFTHSAHRQWFNFACDSGSPKPSTICEWITDQATCEDIWPSKKCSKKCNAKKCAKSKLCKKNCKNTCNLCDIEEPCEDQKSSKYCKKALKKGECGKSSVWKKCKKTCDKC